MKKELTQYIKDLTENDKKSLTEKVAKLFEEGGELAKVILPFEGAYATNHRFVDRRKILEEVADVYLVNQSILYSLGFTDEEFESVVFDKAQVWNGLQVKEDRALSKGDKLPYEIHITINADDGIEIPLFKQHCKEIGVKPIVLALQDQSAEKVMDDVMTSSKFYGNNGEVFDEMKRISTSLKKMGYNIIREKIESSYWHQKAPFKEDGESKMPEGCYFECHLNIECDDEKLPQLSDIALVTDCHLSQNIFKKSEDGSFTIMMTYRSYDLMYEDFEKRLNDIKDHLHVHHFNLEKEIVEFSIYDTKLSHDSKWLEA